jgi:uncharacterized protein involved in exopolysaccharide biosynthesis
MASGYDALDEGIERVEIIDYLESLGRRAWILFGVPAGCALAALVFVVVQPWGFTAGATVAAPALVGGVSAHQYRGADATRGYVTTFAAGLRSAPIVDRTSVQTGVPARRLRAGLHAAGIGNSSFVKVTYTTPRRKEAKTVVRVAAGETLQFLFSSQRNAAQAAVDVAQAQVDKTEAALVELAKQTGVSNPDKEYEAVSSGNSALEALAARRLAHGDAAGAAQVQATLAARNKRLAELAQAQATFSSLVDQRRRAVNELDQVQQRERQASSQLAAADPATVISVGKTRRLIPVSNAIKAVLGGGAAGVFTAVALVLVLEVVSGVRRSGAASLPRPAGWRPARSPDAR